MDDYISQSAAVKAFMNAAELYDPEQGNKRFSLTDVEEILNGVKPADVRPVIPAQWIALDIYRNEENYKCSNCGQPCYVPECMGEPAYSVCPNCGASMGGTS